MKLAGLILSWILSTVSCVNGTDVLKTTSCKHSNPPEANDAKGAFTRVSTFYACEQLGDSCDKSDETVAEAIASSDDGMTVVYANSEAGNIGFIDISNPLSPFGKGTVPLPSGDIQSVAILRDYALVSMDTSNDSYDTSGKLFVVNVTSMEVVTQISLIGAPNTVAVSPDRSYVAVAIENERDESLDEMPALPGGSLAVFDILSPHPDDWVLSYVNLTGLDGITFPTDPEPEHVDINENNKCVITFQENNGIAIVDLETKMVDISFSAGVVHLENVDLTEDSIINQSESIGDIVREPDGITWIGKNFFATADEGDLDGGGRGYTIFNKCGDVIASVNDLDQIAAAVGHYPDGRSDSKGVEPEKVHWERIGGSSFLFVNVERASLTMIFDVKDVYNPKLHQVLPTGVKPEGINTIKSRKLLIISAEEDDREEKTRSSISIYAYKREGKPIYPTLYSPFEQGSLNPPIPFSALSGLSADPEFPHILYSVEDNFFAKNRILKINVKKKSQHFWASSAAEVVKEVYITDARGKLNDVAPALVNNDTTVHLDQEGIVTVRHGFWIVSEGSGGGDAIESENYLVRTTRSGVITGVFSLPVEVSAKQIEYGFKGVAMYENKLIVVFERAWTEELHPRLGIFDLATFSWDFVFYPLDSPTSPNGGWVGLYDISSVGGGDFLVLERDNQGGPDARVKRIYKISLGNAWDGYVSGETITKELYVDMLLSENLPMRNGSIYDKTEGLTVTKTGDVWIVNDNDGVDNGNGEIGLISIGKYGM